MKKIIFLSFFILAITSYYVASSNGIINSKTIRSKIFGPKKILLPEKEKKIEISQNPLVQSKTCSERGTVDFKIYRPKTMHITYPKKIKVVFKAKLFVDDILFSETDIDNDFDYVMPGGSKVNFSYKWQSFDLPSFQENSKEILPIALKIYDLNDALIDSYSTAIKYLEDGQKVEVAHKGYDCFINCGEPQAFQNKVRDLVVTQKGSFFDSYKSSISIQKMPGHYEIKQIHYPGDLYKSESSLRHLSLPNLPMITEQVPLSFELQEMEYEVPTVLGHYQFDSEDVGKEIGYSVSKRIIGKTKTISFEGCEQILEDESTAYGLSEVSLCLLD